jgi:hypothetical protein
MKYTSSTMTSEYAYSIGEGAERRGVVVYTNLRVPLERPDKRARKP